MIVKNTDLWTKSEETTLVIVFAVVFVAMVIGVYSEKTEIPILFKYTPDFFRLDINHASGEELDLLPSIGPARARAIIEYRQIHGKFGNLADLEQVPGISSKTLTKIKNKITY